MPPSIWVATHYPPAMIAVTLFFLTTGMILFIRKVDERKVYDVAFSSFPGDASLALYCGVIAEICQRQLPDGIHMTPEWHMATFIISIAAGLTIHCVGSLLLGAQSSHWNALEAQKYHNIVVIPLLTYSVTSTLPILWYEKTSPPVISAFGFLLFWIFAFFIDLARGNLDPSKNSRMLEATRNWPLM